MKLTVNLARKEVSEFSELVRSTYLEMDNGLEAVESTNELSFPSQAYIQRDKLTQPKWVNYLGGHFDVSRLENTSNSFVLLAKVSGRIFALTFGMSGYNSLERSKLVHGFGLRVCANSVDKEGLNTVDTRNLDTVTRQQRTQLSAGSRLADFSIPLEQEWIRRISGKSATLDFAKTLSGSDSLHINVSVSLSRIDGVLKQLLERYESSDYKKDFPFLDYYQPIDKGSDTAIALDRVLASKLTAKNFDKVALAAPQIVDDEQIDHYKLTARRKTALLDEVTLTGAYEFLERHYGGDSPLEDCKIVPVSESGQAAGQKRTLHDWVVCELDVNDKTYVLSLGNWYEVDRDYVRSVNTDVQRIPDLTEKLSLERWDPTEKEGDYNKRVAATRNWLLMDKENFYIGGPSQKNEICDLLTEDLHFICVKQQNSSATLSHLFSQGSVSAEMFRGEVRYRERVFRDAREFWGRDIPEPEDGPTVVYAISNDREGKLADRLFFFSKVSLLFNARIVQRLNFRVAVARIEMPPGSLRQHKRKRRTKKDA